MTGREWMHQDAGGRPPWEEPGAHRLDLPPDRAHTLRMLAWASVALAPAGLLLCLPALPGLVLALAVCHLAANDLDRMRSRKMDPRGRGGTLRALGLALAGLALSLLAGVCACLWGVPLKVAAFTLRVFGR